MCKSKTEKVVSIEFILPHFNWGWKFIGGPGGGKTKYAAKVRDTLEDEGLIHLCMPDMIRAAIEKYKDRYRDWKEAAEKFQRGNWQ